MQNQPNILSSGVNLITSDITHPHSIRLLRKLVYAWFLVNTLILIPAGDEFWGQHSLIPKIDPEIVNAHPLLYLLNLNIFAPYYEVFVGLQIILLIAGILCIYPRIVSILIYFITINLDNKAYVILDGGNNLLQITLLYLIVMDPSLEKNRYRNTTINQINNALSNLGFYMVRLQLVMVYLVSGLGKISGELWQNGTALYYTLNIDEYSHPLAKKMVSNYPIISVLGTYATVVYQVAFPWLVWNRKIRPYLLAFGTFIHIQIAFVMGLFMFGFAIAVVYFSFATDPAAKRLLDFPGSLRRFFKRRLVPTKFGRPPLSELLGQKGHNGSLIARRKYLGLRR